MFEITFAIECVLRLQAYSGIIRTRRVYTINAVRFNGCARVFLFTPRDTCSSAGGTRALSREIRNSARIYINYVWRTHACVWRYFPAPSSYTWPWPRGWCARRSSRSNPTTVRRNYRLLRTAHNGHIMLIIWGSHTSRIWIKCPVVPTQV
jgi:hypothetical protein